MRIPCPLPLTFSTVGGEKSPPTLQTLTSIGGAAATVGIKPLIGDARSAPTAASHRQCALPPPLSQEALPLHQI
jgi:hypothetical protein